jgi:predicted enzyme related to lactoylglutathione lyase
MGTRTSHPPGTLSWTDLATSDPGAAKTFYGELFGWSAEDADAGEGNVYTTFRLDGSAVAGLFAKPDEIPTSWTSYVTVADADAAAGQSGELGGQVYQPPFDVMDAGRMSVLADPAGAVFAVWQPRAGIGAERVNDLGCMCMNELVTGDIDAAHRFYGGLFGWTFEAVDTGPDGPAVEAVRNEGTLNASLLVDAEAPAHWRPYFTVASTDAAADQVAGLGGSVLLGPIPTGDGSIAVVTDPQGAVFGLFEGEVDP